MKEIVIVPTYRRTEFLHCSLEAIRAADPAIPVHVFPDRGTDERATCDRFSAIHHLTWDHNYHGNSANMLEALRWASTQSCGLVYVIEDDAIIAPDFFRWCHAALSAHPTAFAACGWRYSPDSIISDGPDLLIPWYLSVAAALPHRSVSEISQHARPDYYSAMSSYLDSRYPNSAYRNSLHHEQDGLVLRVAESQSRRSVWPRRPRAFHIGFQGYHSPGPALEGDLDQRIEIVRLAIRYPDLLSVLMSGGLPPRLSPCSACARPLPVSRLSGRTAICAACYHAAHPTLAVTTASHYYFPNGI